MEFHLLADSGISISNMLIGNIGGCIGETSAVLIILGGLYLMYKGIIIMLYQHFIYVQ